MKRQIIIVISLLIGSISLTGQYPYKYFERGDTLRVFAMNGISLREKPSIKSDKIKTIPFRSSVVIESDYYQNYETFENRQGGWIMVKSANENGYVFSGYLTDKKIPNIKIEKQKCLRIHDFYNFIKTNIGDTICSGIDTLKIFGKGKMEFKEWMLHENGDEIIYETSYENLDIIFSTYRFTMNDIINFLEVYIKSRCLQDYNSVKIKISKGKLGFVEQIECQELWFKASFSLNKLIVRFNEYNL